MFVSTDSRLIFIFKLEMISLAKDSHIYLVYIVAIGTRLVNSEHPDGMPQNAASDEGLRLL